MYLDSRPENEEPDGTAAMFEDSRAALALHRLGAVSPPDTFSRFRKRAAVLQGTRILFESQVFGFWIVLNALLRILLGSRPAVRLAVSRRGGK